MTTTRQTYPGGCAVKLNDTHIMVVGGLEEGQGNEKYLSSAWILNLADYTWQLVEPMNQEPCGPYSRPQVSSVNPRKEPVC